MEYYSTYPGGNLYPFQGDNKCKMYRGIFNYKLNTYLISSDKSTQMF